MRSYETARSLFYFLEFCAWSMVVFGVLAAMIGGGSVSQYSSNGAGLLAALPGLAMAFFGLFQVAVVQNARATVDTAEYTQQMLKIARDQLEISKQSLKPVGDVPKSFASIEAKEKPAAKPENLKTTPEKASPVEVTEECFYRGHRIKVNNNKYVCDGREFDTLISAKTHIEKLDGGLLEKAPRS